MKKMKDLSPFARELTLFSIKHYHLLFNQEGLVKDLMKEMKLTETEARNLMAELYNEVFADFLKRLHVSEKTCNKK